MKHLTIDPVGIQNQFMDKIDKASGFETVDPTNSFSMLVEANSLSTSDVITELFSYERKFFPSLAKNMDDLYPHMVEFDEKDFFASPAVTSVRVWIDLNSIYQFGDVDDSKTIYKLTIPKNSTVQVDGVDLTIMNDINVTVNNRGDKIRTFIENKIDESSFVFLNHGNTISGVTVDEKNVNWVIFDIPVMQVTHLEVKDKLTLGVEYNELIPHEDQFYFTKVSYKDISGKEVVIPKVFTDTEFDPTKLSVYVKVLDNQIQYKIPKVYIDNGLISGEITIHIYSTKGKIKMPLSKYSSSDYGFLLNRTSSSLATAAAAKVNYKFSSTFILDGGVDVRPMKDVKNKIIYRTGNRTDLPITEKQLGERSKLDGFTIKKVVDVLTDRLFIASKNINDTIDPNINAPIDAFNTTLVIERGNGLLYKNIDTTSSERTIIKPGCLFRSSNGKVSPIDDTTNVMDTLTAVEKVNYLNDNNILYTPFLYIITNDTSTTTSKVYDIDRARLDMLTTVSKNEYLLENVNINGYKIFRVEEGYDIFFQVIGNTQFDAIKHNIGIQLTLTNDIGNRSSFHSVLNQAKEESVFGIENVKDRHYIHIPSSFNIDNFNKISFVNTNATPRSISVDIHTKAEIIIYHKGNSILTADNVKSSEANQYLSTGAITLPNSTDYVGMAKETVNIFFADDLEYLWRRVLVSYTNRKYKQYANDIPLNYDKNIYSDNSDCPIKITKNADGTCSSVTLDIKHAKGTPVLDKQNKPILKHNKGDTILDSDNKPIFDRENGTSILLDVFMLEYSYKLLGKTKYADNINSAISLVRTWILDKMPTLNKSVLEHTKVLYKPTRSNSNINISDGIIDSEISPTITIYLGAFANKENLDYKKLYNDIGSILNRYFGKKYIAINDLEKMIADEIDGAEAIKISNFAKDDPMIINLENSTTRLVMKKKINNDFDIIYDYNLKIK